MSTTQASGNNSSETIIAVLDWSGQDDPDNPRNFSQRRRILSTIAGTLLASVSTFAASIYSPGISVIAAEFGVSEEIATLPLSFFNLGLAAGPLVGSPLSETCGRKAVILYTTPVFAAFTLGCGFSNNIVALTTCRFFAGMFAAPAVGNASATITDYTAGRYRAISMAFYYAMPTFGTSLGPLIGGFVVQTKGWRWTQWTTLFFIVAFYFPNLFTKESYKKAVLERRAKESGLEIPGDNKTTAQVVYNFATVLIFRPVHMLLTEPIVGLVCLYNGFMFGLIYTFVVASPWIYEFYYDFSLTAVNLSFIGLLVGTIVTPLPLILIDHLVYQPRLKRFRALNFSDEPFPPEHRLYPAMLASFGLPVMLIVFAWTTRNTIHWICPVIFQGLTMTCNLMIYAPANLYMIDAYGPLYGASAAGAAMLSRYFLAAAFPLFSVQMYKSLGVGWATSILAFCALILAPVPFLFYRVGSYLRIKTKYETSM